MNQETAADSPFTRFFYYKFFIITPGREFDGVVASLEF
jgi:hypothetical protein